MFGAISGVKALGDFDASNDPLIQLARPAWNNQVYVMIERQQLHDVGFFAQPGNDASKNGLTVWMPAGCTRGDS